MRLPQFEQSDVVYNVCIGPLMSEYLGSLQGQGCWLSIENGSKVCDTSKFLTSCNLVRL